MLKLLVCACVHGVGIGAPPRVGSIALHSIHRPDSIGQHALIYLAAAAGLEGDGADAHELHAEEVSLHQGRRHPKADRRHDVLCGWCV